jgi:hypothetical protein
MDQLLGSSITYRIAVGPQQGRKVFTLQTLPACDEPFDDGVGMVAGFSLHAGVAARAGQRQKLERLCRYISRPAIAVLPLVQTTALNRSGSQACPWCIFHLAGFFLASVAVDSRASATSLILLRADPPCSAGRIMPRLSALWRVRQCVLVCAGLSIPSLRIR